MKQPVYQSEPSDTLVTIPLLALLLVFIGYLASTVHYWFPPPPPDPDKLGMVIRDPWYDFGTHPGHPEQPNYAAQDRMGALLHQMGVRWVRLEFHIEGTDAFSVTQVARNDYFIREVAPRYNFRILGLLGFGLIRDYDPHLLGRHTPETDLVYGAGIDDIKRLWLNRARMIVNRYQGQVDAYELFNEPNRVSRHGDVGIPAPEIARLHATFYTFFRSIDRSAPGDEEWRDDVEIILGGLQPAGTGSLDDSGYLSDREYLRQIYTSDSFAHYYEIYHRFPVDGVGYHPYPREIFSSMTGRSGKLNVKSPGVLPTKGSQLWDRTAERDMGRVLRRLDQMRRVLIEVGDSAKPFWITEIGFNAGYPGQDEATQADMVRLSYSLLAARGDIEHIFWFKFEDFPPGIGPAAQQWGTVIIPFILDAACPGRSCYEARARPVRIRPSFWAYRDLAGRASSLPEPPAEVIISGPTIAPINMPVIFSALVSRPTGAQPVTYAWQADRQADVIHQGSLQDSVTFTWKRPGTYTLMVEATNAGGSVIARYDITVRRPLTASPYAARACSRSAIRSCASSMPQE